MISSYTCGYVRKGRCPWRGARPVVLQLLAKVLLDPLRQLLEAESSIVPQAGSAYRIVDRHAGPLPHAGGQMAGLSFVEIPAHAGILLGPLATDPLAVQVGEDTEDAEALVVMQGTTDLCIRPTA